MAFSASYSPREVVAALSSGIDSFVHKSTGMPDLLRAIEKTYQGESVWLFGHETVLAETSTPSVASDASLTEREGEVLVLLLRRFSNEEIAEELTLARQTVKNHVSNVFRKVGVNNRRELLRQTVNKLTPVAA